tara:strand:- start:841 stop:1206 length:366 start_codon:yes stop_codon:yes gene_type:complete
MDIQEKIDIINKKIDNIESIINSKIDPLVDLVQVLIKNGIERCNNETQNDVEIKNTPDLLYKECQNNVLIYGNKTYENKELIKSTFRDAGWDKQKTAWVFKKFDNFEKVLLDVFPNIIKDQ